MESPRSGCLGLQSQVYYLKEIEMSRSNFIAETVRLFGGFHFVRDNQKAFSVVSAINLGSNGLIGTSSHFSARFVEEKGYLDIHLEHKDTSHKNNVTHATIVRVDPDYVGGDNLLSSDVVKALSELMADWAVEVEKGNEELSKTDFKKGDVVLVNVAIQKPISHPFFLDLEERTLSGELDLMEVSHASAYGFIGDSLSTGERIRTTWEGLMSQG